MKRNLHCGKMDVVVGGVNLHHLVLRDELHVQVARLVQSLIVVLAASHVVDDSAVGIHSTLVVAAAVGSHGWGSTGGESKGTGEGRGRCGVLRSFSGNYQDTKLAGPLSGRCWLLIAEQRMHLYHLTYSGMHSTA